MTCTMIREADPSTPTTEVTLGQLAHWSTLKTVVVVFLLSLMAVTGSRAQTFTTLWAFGGTNGASPFAGLVQGFDGSLYGMTPTGGNTSGTSNCPFGCGAVFKLATAGTLTTLYNFCSQTNCTDGDLPYGGLMLGTDGNLYGTTAGGGANGYGMVFKITEKGKLTTLHSFCSQLNCTDGSGSISGLVQGSSGTFYGTAVHGGANNTCSGGCGTIFNLTPAGKLTTIYNFCSEPNCADGEYPQANLVQAANGNFYGTTAAGGNSICTYGCGTVFEITPAGKVTTIYSFCSLSACADGLAPVGALVQASNGDLYGATSYGGSGNNGEVFQITTTGKLTTIYSFCVQSLCSDGAHPNAGLVQGSDGNFYGTTAGGGAYSHGAIFRITPTGQLTALYSFCPQNGCADGAYPYAPLIQASNGDFYGTTYGGGTANSDCTSGCGTIFTLSSGLSPFIETLPNAGRVGQGIVILGNDLTESTKVSFNGTLAPFTVISPTEIRTHVPAGATSGKVTVLTLHGPVADSTVFRVTP